MNIFDIYPLDEDRHPEAPNWEFRVDSWVRSDGATLNRSHSKAGWHFSTATQEDLFISIRDTSGRIDDADGLGIADELRPLPQPLPAVGQVWVSKASASMIEWSILGVQRRTTGVVVVTTYPGVECLAVPWEPLPTPCALVAGPGSPWVSPDWETEELPVVAEN